jgi:hypothetical protein
MASREERILILCKTYPTPSAAHSETSCVAGMCEDGTLIRLFPVPFRLINDESQFRKWQWVTVRVEKAKKDHRPESHRIFVDTIQCDANPLSTDDRWRDRRVWLEKVEVFDDFGAVQKARVERGITLAVLRPSRILSLDIKPTAEQDWTAAEREKLLQMQHQSDLFDDSDSKSLRLLRKIPYDFHYNFQCEVGDAPISYRHKIVDWEAGALFWNVHQSHGSQWEPKFREKLESDLPKADLMFLLGTVHRFPDQWLIVSLIYPPKQRPESERQPSLF